MIDEAMDQDARARRAIVCAIEEARGLVGDGSVCEIPETEHERLANQLRVAYHALSDPKNPFTLDLRERSSLLATGLVLHRVAPSSKRSRDELATTAALVFATLFADQRVDAASAERSTRVVGVWLDASWRGILDADEAEAGADADAAEIAQALCGGSLTRDAIAMASFAYWSSSALRIRKSAFECATVVLEAPQVPHETLVADPHARAIVSAADAELGQQARRCPLCPLCPLPPSTRLLSDNTSRVSRPS